MKRIVYLGVAAALLGAAPANAYAQDVLTSDPTLPTTRVGTRGGTALTLPVGARAQALGGAYTALANDISALYWNTAGIAQLEGFSAGFTEASLYGDLDITHTFVGAVLPIGLSRFGLSVNLLSSGEMVWTDADFPNPEPYGEDFNAIRSTFEWNTMVLGGHFARPITDRLNFGGALKFITEGISTAEANFVAVDVGAQFETGLYGLSLGASLLNVGTKGRMEGTELQTRVNTSDAETQVGTGGVRVVGLGFNTTELDLPTTFRFSIMADLMGGASSLISPSPDQNLRLVWDLADAVDTDLQTAVGLEYAFRDMAFLRVGKRWSNEAQISYDFTRGAAIGGGLRVPVGGFGRVQLDYAYTGMGDLDNIQTFGVEVHF